MKNMSNEKDQCVNTAKLYVTEWIEKILLFCV